MTGLRTYQDAVAIVTGAGSGIGRAIAIELARRGGEVVLADIELDDARTVADEIAQGGGRASAQRLDVADAASVEALIAQIVADHGRLDYLFNNAGIAVTGDVSMYTPESWRRIVEVNLMGVVHGVQAAYPRMLAQGYGHIVNIASTAGLLPSPSLVSYSTTKHAVVGLSRGLRAEAHGRGVRVSAVCPGVIRTAILQGGKHGILLRPLSEQDERRELGDFFERFRPMPSDLFARRLLDRVARNQGIIVIPGWWRLLWWLDRLSPRLSDYLARRAFAAEQRRLAARLAAGRPQDLQKKGSGNL